MVRLARLVSIAFLYTTDRTCRRNVRTRLQFFQYSATNHKYLQKIFRNLNPVEKIIVRHDVIKNTFTKHPHEKRIPFTTAEVLSKKRAFPHFVSKNSCVRETADDIHSEVGTLPVLKVHVVKDLISNSKRKDKLEIGRRTELHEDHTMDLHFLEVVLKNSLDFESI